MPRGPRTRAARGPAITLFAYFAHLAPPAGRSRPRAVSAPAREAHPFSPAARLPDSGTALAYWAAWIS